MALRTRRSAALPGDLEVDGDDPYRSRTPRSAYCIIHIIDLTRDTVRVTLAHVRSPSNDPRGANVKHRLITRSVAVMSTLALITLSACGSSSKTPNANAAGGGSSGGGTPVNGGTLRLIHESDPSGLMDPAKMQTLVETAGADMFFDIYSTLLYADTSANPPTVKPLLAQSFTSPDNGTTWVLKLRPNLVFSDGTPLDAAAVKFNWDRLTNPATGAPMASSLANVASTTVTDAQTLTVTLKQANTLFPNLVAEGAASYIASPTAIQKEGQNFGGQPVGAGPFVLKSWTPNVHASLVKNPTYFDAKDVHLDGIEITTAFNSQTKANAFSTGAVDMMFVGLPVEIQAVKSAGGTVTDFPLLGPLALVWNANKPPFNDQSMRVAFAQALDRNAIAQAYAGQPDPQPAGVLPSTSPYYDPKAIFPKYDPSAAKTAVQAYEATHGPIKLTFLYVTGTAATDNAAQVLQQQLQAIPGVTVTLKGLDLSAWFTGMYQGDYSIGTSGLPFANLADPYLYNTLHTKGSFNLYGYSNPKIDAALDDARNTTSTSRQLSDYHTVQEALTADSFFLPFSTSLYAQGYTKKVHFFGFGDAIPRTDLIWLSK